MSEPSRTAESLLRALDRRASAAALAGSGLLLLAGAWGLESWLSANARVAQAEAEASAAALADLEEALAERRAVRDLFAGAVAGARRDAASLSRSRRALYEGGLALAEEKRLLEKQWEILTTYLQLDAGADRLRVIRGEQSFEAWPLGGARPRAEGGDKRPLPALATIVSKERFAAPERGASAVVDGRLDWEPPQVGTSARARALGESVMFTREGLVIHGPPLDAREHAAYPHLCLRLPAASARRVFARAFIGTRVRLAPAP